MTNDLPSVGTEDARSMAYAQEDGDRSGCWYPGKAAGEMLRTLVLERDALAVRVRGLEAAVWVAHEALSKSPCDAKFVQQCSVCSALDYTRAALTTPESKP